MCDYSLESQISRSAQAGDRIKTSVFPNMRTRGFCDCGNARIAVCLLPGTEISFDQPISAHGMWGGSPRIFWGLFLSNHDFICGRNQPEIASL